MDNSSTGLNEHTIVGMAQAIAKSGLADVGYEYVNLEWAPLPPRLQPQPPHWTVTH